MKRKNPVLLTEKSKEMIPGIIKMMTASEICMNQKQISKVLHCADDPEFLRALEWLRFQHILECTICPQPCKDDMSVYYKIHK